MNNYAVASWSLEASLSVFFFRLILSVSLTLMLIFPLCPLPFFASRCPTFEPSYSYYLSILLPEPCPPHPHPALSPCQPCPSSPRPPAQLPSPYLSLIPQLHSFPFSITLPAMLIQIAWFGKTVQFQ